MKRLILIASLLAVIILLLPSCAAFYQRAYVANAPNVNYFAHNNEKNLNFSLFLNHIEAQSNFALSKHFGMSACLNAGFREQFGAEMAGIYYKRFSDKHYFETQLGYGYNKNITQVYAAWSLFAGETGTWYGRSSNVRYHKIFVQPTYFITDPKSNIDYGLALKISANYFDKYYYNYSLEEGDKNGGDWVDFSTSDFRYKWCMVFEPSVKILLKNTWFFQFSGLISTNASKTTLYRGYDPGPDYTMGQITQQSIGDPQHLGFLITVGFKIKMNHDKDKVKDE